MTHPNPMNERPKPVIAEHPPKEFYAAGLEIDCQCARCGSSCNREECSECYGEGLLYDYDEEIDDFPSYRCDACDGRGGWQVCLSSPEFCKANPLPGRENIERGQIEWFTVEEKQWHLYT